MTQDRFATEKQVGHFTLVHTSAHRLQPGIQLPSPSKSACRMVHGTVVGSKYQLLVEAHDAEAWCRVCRHRKFFC